MSYVFIQGLIFWGLGCGCSGKQEGGRWHSSTSSKDRVKCEHPSGELCRAQSVRSLFGHVLLPTYLTTGAYCYLCCADYAEIMSLLATYSPCQIPHEMTLLPSMANEVLVAGTVK